MAHDAPDGSVRTLDVEDYDPETKISIRSRSISNTALENLPKESERLGDVVTVLQEQGSVASN